jgi:N-acetylglutamate synthase-like GNAT family acetyltransferase
MNGDIYIHLACADYLERKAANLGLENLFLLTTRTADWLVPNSFKPSTLFPSPVGLFVRFPTFV